MTTVDSDVFAEALTDPGGHDHPLIVERADGHRSITDLAWWRRTRGAHAPSDNMLLDWIAPDETVIDIGCATGRQLEQLAGRGVHAIGVDSCAAAVQIAHQHRLAAVCADARVWTPPAPVTTVLALGGGAGMCGTLDAFDGWLAHVSSWLTDAGRLIVTSVDWRTTADHAGTQAQGRYPGGVTLRLRYRDTAGEWFPWLWIDPELLTERARNQGLHVGQTVSWGAKYGLELRRKASR